MKIVKSTRALKLAFLSAALQYASWKLSPLNIKYSIIPRSPSNLQFILCVWAVLRLVLAVFWIHLANVELPNAELPNAELVNAKLVNAELVNTELPNAELLNVESY